MHNEQIFTKSRKSVEIQAFLRYSNNHSRGKIGRNNIFHINCSCRFGRTQYLVFTDLRGRDECLADLVSAYENYLLNIKHPSIHELFEKSPQDLLSSMQGTLQIFLSDISK